MRKINSLGMFVVVLVFAGAFLLSCSSPGQPEPPQEQPIPNPSFGQDIQAAIFNTSCATSNCHDATANAGLDIRQGQAYNNTVNVNSSQDATKLRVAPGDATNSYLVIKIEGRQTIGGRMPLNRSPLSSAKIQTIKNWINNGANNN